MLIDAGLPCEFWAEAVSTANHVRNLVPSRQNRMSPWKLFKGSKPDLSMLRVFGCLAYAQVPKKLRNKLDKSSKKGVFVGYEPNAKGWRVMRPGDDGIWNVVISRDVQFMEEKIGFSAFNIQKDNIVH
jgi:hypothetical protein